MDSHVIVKKHPKMKQVHLPPSLHPNTRKASGGAALDHRVQEGGRCEAREAVLVMVAQVGRQPP
jgi:hypothetical protein